MINKFKLRLKSKDNIVLIQNFISLSILQGVNYILPLITVPYLTRVLGPGKYGLMGFALAFMGYFKIITDYGFNLSATQQISLNREDVKKVSEIFSSVMVIKIAFTIISSILVMLVVLSFSKFKSDALVYYISFVTVIGSVLFPLWLFQGLEKMKYITNVNIVVKIITTILTFVMINSEKDFISLLLLNSFSSLAVGIISLFIVFKSLKIKFIFPTLQAIKRDLIEGWYIFISSISIVLYTSSTTVILGIFTNDVTVGYFVGADKIRTAIQGLLSPLFQAVYPYMSKLAKRSKEDLLKFVRKELMYVGFIGVLIFVFMFIYAEFLSDMLLGSEYKNAIPIIKIMAIDPLLVILGNILTIQCMLSLGLKKQYSRIYLLTSIIGVTTMIVLTYLYGINGTAVSMILIELLVTIFTIFSLKKNKVEILSYKH